MAEAEATFSVRMDDSLNEFEMLCSDFEMNMSTAINVFAKTVVREPHIPFEIASHDTSSRESHESFFVSPRRISKELSKRDGS